MASFIGVDLGWYGKPSGLASIVVDGQGLSLRQIARIAEPEQIFEWIGDEAGNEPCVVAVDAPLVICNDSGIRPAERDLNRDYRRYHAGCHAANLGRPFAQNVTSFSRRLQELGFSHGAGIRGRDLGRFQIEVHPHAATVSLFGLDLIVKYKKGIRRERAAELSRLRELMLSRLPVMDPPLRLDLPAVPGVGSLKPLEDQIDAVMCAYIGAYWWFWGRQRSRLYGDEKSGYIVVPERQTAPVPAAARAITRQ